MSEITKFTNDNIPGVKELYYSIPENISNILIDEENSLAIINFNENYTWEKIYFTPNSIIADLDNADNTEAGTIYKHNLTFYIPKENKNISSLIFYNNFKELIFKIKTQNNSEIILGFKDNPMIRKTTKFTLSKKYNGYELKYEGKFYIPALFL